MGNSVFSHQVRQSVAACLSEQASGWPRQQAGAVPNAPGRAVGCQWRRLLTNARWGNEERRAGWSFPRREMSRMVSWQVGSRTNVDVGVVQPDPREVIDSNAGLTKRLLSVAGGRARHCLAPQLRQLRFLLPAPAGTAGLRSMCPRTGCIQRDQSAAALAGYCCRRLRPPPMR